MAMKVSFGDRTLTAEVLRYRPDPTVHVAGGDISLQDPGAVGNGRVTLIANGEKVTTFRATLSSAIFVRVNGRTYEFTPIDPHAEAAGGGGAADAIMAPMPGALVTLHKSAGDSVLRGEAVMTIESMKLQMALLAERDGEIAEILAAEGDTFDKGSMLARLVPVGQEE